MLSFLLFILFNLRKSYIDFDDDVDDDMDDSYYYYYYYHYYWDVHRNFFF